MPKKDYKDIHPDFNQELIQDWVIQGFTFEQTFDWVRNTGLTIYDAFYAGWLRDIKNLDSEWVLNCGDDKSLRAEYKDWQLSELTSLNVPKHTPTNFSYQTLLIMVILAVIILYLLT